MIGSHSLNTLQARVIGMKWYCYNVVGGALMLHTVQNPSSLYYYPQLVFRAFLDKVLRYLLSKVKCCDWLPELKLDVFVLIIFYIDFNGLKII
jgi:hypothetical protein